MSFKRSTCDYWTFYSPAKSCFPLENDLPPGVVLSLESLCGLVGRESRRTFARKFADEWTRLSDKNCLIRHQRVSHDQFPSPEQRGRAILEHENVLNCVHLPSWYIYNIYFLTMKFSIKSHNILEQIR